MLGLAAGEDLGAAPSLLDPLEDALAVALVDHRPDVGLLVGRVADLQRLDLRQEALEECVADVAVDVDPLDGDAALARERERVRRELRRRLVEVGVRLDDHRRRVAELEADPLPRARAREAPSRRCRSR